MTYETLYPLPLWLLACGGLACLALGAFAAWRLTKRRMQRPIWRREHAFYEAGIDPASPLTYSYAGTLASIGRISDCTIEGNEGEAAFKWPAIDPASIRLVGNEGGKWTYTAKPAPEPPKVVEGVWYAFDGRSSWEYGIIDGKVYERHDGSAPLLSRFPVEAFLEWKRRGEIEETDLPIRLQA